MGYEIRTFPLVFDKEIQPVPKENHADEEIDNRRDFRQKRRKVNDELQRQLDQYIHRQDENEDLISPALVHIIQTKNRV